jgi:chromosomal replication initiation ATPase DnaA
MNQARAMAIYLARDLSGLPGRELGNYFGGVSGAAVTMCYKQFSYNLSQNKSLQDLVSKTKKCIFNF